MTTYQEGHLTIEKVTTSEPANGETYALGETITYKITATNDGNLTITEITVTDELTEDEWKIESLAPGASEEFETSYTVTEADILAGEVLNVATAKGKSPDPDDPDVPVDPGKDPEPTEDKKGHLTIEKVTTSEPANGKTYALGETITYKITATNDGNLTITEITVTDELTEDEWKIESLAPGASEEFETSYTVTEADILAGEVLNVATAKGKSPDPDNPETPVTPGEDPEEVDDLDTTLSVNKKITSEPADGKAYQLGETIAYAITVTNEGNVPYENVKVKDELTGLEETIKILAVGEAKTFTTEHVVTEDDILAGSVTNTAVAAADPIDDPKDPENPKTPEGEDEVTTGDKDDPDGPTSPVAEPDTTLTVVKTVTSTPANGESYVIGEKITYEITVTNEGNVPYTNVVVTDKLTGDEWTIVSLAVGAKETFEAAYTVTQADVTVGSVTNVATAAGDPINDPKNPDEPKKPEGEGTTETPVGKSVRLTVRYWIGTEPAADTFTSLYNYGAAYNVASPAVTGFTPDQERVTGTITENTTLDVYYTRNSYTLTIYYRYTDGGFAAESYVATMAYGEWFRIASPEIAGYTPSRAFIQDDMPARDATYVVFYSQQGNGVIIEDYDTPLGLGNVSINVGDCYE